VERALGLGLPHAVVVLVDGEWRHAWLLGTDRDAEGASFLLQRLDDPSAEPRWLSDVELGEADARYRDAQG